MNVNNGGYVEFNNLAEECMGLLTSINDKLKFLADNDTGEIQLDSTEDLTHSIKTTLALNGLCERIIDLNSDMDEIIISLDIDQMVVG